MKNFMKKIVVFMCVMFGLLCVACGSKTEDSASDEQLLSEVKLDTEDMYDTEEAYDTEESSKTENSKAESSKAEGGKSQSVENQNTENVNDKKQSKSIQDELAEIELKSAEYENADWGSMGQQDMNQLTAEWYQLWDDELNSLWSRLSDELDAETKAKVLEEQRAWITRKDENIKGAGAAVYGGSMQAQLENSTAKDLTRARAYILAGYLAKVRNESFSISSEIQKSIDMADPSLDDVFKKFEGQWIFDEERGACVGIERTENCAYGVPGSEWTVWVTGGDLISDLDVYGYTENSIVFRTVHNDGESFHMLSFNVENALIYEYGTSLAAMDDMIVCSED
jgi:uncharacterized protein YecT (DUF1311 family)